MKYAVYGRVSSDKDEQVSSLENQIEICRYWIERNNLEWDEKRVYLDDGISGTVLLERPAMQEILRKAKEKEIDVVLFKSIHRLARDLKDALEIREVFAAYNVRMISVEEGYDSFKVSKNDMSFEMHSMFADQYAKTTSASVSAALAAKVRRGESFAKIPYGYDRVDKKLVINEEKAKVVKYIFELKLSGLGYISISKRLNEEGILSPSGKMWGYTTVATIIRNATYKGEYIANKYTNIKIAGKKKQIINPKEKWQIYKNQHPAIIEEEKWNEVNDERLRGGERNKKISAWNEFRGLAKCSECEAAMVVDRSGFRTTKKTGERKYWEYMRCSTYRRYREHGCVRHKPLQYQYLREFVISNLKSINKLDFYLSQEERRDMDVKYEMRKIKNEIKNLETQSKELLNSYLENIFPIEVIKQKQNEIDIKIHKLQSELFNLNKHNSKVKKIEEIKYALEMLENEEQDLYEVFKKLISKIVIHPEGKIDIEYLFNVEK